VQWSGNVIVSFTFLTLAQSVGFSASFWLFGLISLAAWLFFFFLVPETKGRSLEEIEETWLKKSDKSSEQQKTMVASAGVR